MKTLEILNSPSLYLIVGVVIAFIAVFCMVFLVQSYRAGVAIGMDPKKMKRTIVSSITFSLFPSLSILLGVIALSGALGIPLPWLRLSVIGALNYEVSVAEIAATSVGLSGLSVAEMTPQAFVSIALVMSLGIIGGGLCTIFFLKKYQNKMALKGSGKSANGRIGFTTLAMSALFIGLCSTYLGSYIGVFVRKATPLPLIAALISASAMAFFMYLKNKKGYAFVGNFSLAVSMLLAMSGTIFANLLLNGGVFGG